MATAITAREFKLLLKPELFLTKQAVLQFNDELTKLSKDAGVRLRAVRSRRFGDASGAVF